MDLCIFAVIATMSVQEHAGNEKSCVWHATDFADGELKDELFCIRFASIESESWYLQLCYSLFEFLIGKSGFSLDATASVNLFNCWKIKILMNLMRFSYEYMWFIILFLLVGKLFWTSFEFAIVFDLNVVHFCWKSIWR